MVDETDTGFVLPICGHPKRVGEGVVMSRSVVQDLQDCYHPLSTLDIEQFETRLGASLPTDYREFLLRYNGGTFHRYVTHGPSGATVTELYGVETGDYADIEYVRAILDDMLGAIYIPIGATGTGGTFCVAVRGRGRGHVDLLRCNDYGPGRIVTSDSSFKTFWSQLVADPTDTSSRTDRFLALVDDGDFEAVARQLAMGQNVNHADMSGETALMVAAAKCHPELVRECIRYGADVNVRNARGAAALHYAARYGSLDSARLLIRANADINCQNDVGFSPLMTSIDACQMRVTKFLIERGADVNIAAKTGATALSLCTNSWAMQREIRPMLQARAAGGSISE